MKIVMASQFFVKFSNIKFNENPFSHFRVLYLFMVCLTKLAVVQIMWRRMIGTFYWRDWGKSWKPLGRIAGFRAEIWTRDLLNSKQECRSSNHSTATFGLSSRHMQANGRTHEQSDFNRRFAGIRTHLKTQDDSFSFVWFLPARVLIAAFIVMSRAVTKVLCAWGKLLNCPPPPAQKIIKLFYFYINCIHFAPLHVLCLGRVPHLPQLVTALVVSVM
jgi:hypothetical protein